MSKKNILIATQSLGIGGCETYILTQCKVFIKCGYNVTIIAKDGVLRKEFENIGVKFYDLDLFKIDENLINEISKIIEKEKISQVHIHPFYPFYNTVVASILMKVPYVLYFHGIVDIENMFEEIIGKDINKLFLSNIVFKYASRYIYVSEESRSFIENKFNLDKGKGELLKNSIYLKDLNVEPLEVRELLNFVIVSRLDEDKLNSVKQAVDFYIRYFLEYSKKHGDSKKIKLDICGEGNAIERVKEYINKVSDIDYNINLIGPCKTEIFETINKYDVVLGMGRCILEAMSIKKLPVLVSYDRYIGLINVGSTQMDKLSYSNFSGRGLEKGDMIKDIKFLLETDSKKISDIIKQNYEYLETYNNLENNIDNINNIINNDEMLPFLEDMNSYIELINDYNDLKADKVRCFELYESLKKDYSIIMEQHQKDLAEIVKLKEELEKRNLEYVNVKKQLDDMENRKFYKICKRIKNFFKIKEE